jgi:hypothetical protein
MAQEINMDNFGFEKILHSHLVFKDEGVIMKQVLSRQVGGEHYMHFEIQPVEFITKNKLGFLEGCIIKRLCRYQNKGGLADLHKSQHELELLIEFEYPGTGGGTA